MFKAGQTVRDAVRTVKLHKMELVKDNQCWKCQNAMGSGGIAHSFPLFGNKLLKRLESGWPLHHQKQIPFTTRGLKHLVCPGNSWVYQIKLSFTDWLKLMTDTASFDNRIARSNDGKGRY